VWVCVCVGVCVGVWGSMCVCGGVFLGVFGCVSGEFWQPADHAWNWLVPWEVGGGWCLAYIHICVDKASIGKFRQTVEWYLIMCRIPWSRWFRLYFYWPLSSTSPTPHRPCTSILTYFIIWDVLQGGQLRLAMTLYRIIWKFCHKGKLTPWAKHHKPTTSQIHCHLDKNIIWIFHHQRSG